MPRKQKKNNILDQIEITLGKITITVNCLDTPTSKAILSALPIHSTANTWGQEVYFSVPVFVEKEADAKDVMDRGEIAFWVEGNCIAIGYGPTPISEGNEIRLAAKTNIWGHTNSNLDLLSSIQEGSEIKMRKL